MNADIIADETFRLIRQSARAVTTAGGGLNRVRSLRFAKPGFSTDMWREICDLGWPSLLLAEDKGGTGLGMQALGSLMTELGRGLAPEPVAQAAIAATYLSANLLDDVIAGKRIIVLALQESFDDLARAPAARFADGRITGRKTHIASAAGATAFLVTTDQGLALVDREASGVKLETLRTQDGDHFGILTMEDSPATFLSVDDGSAFDRAVIATSCYLLGVLEESMDRTIEFLKIREQFRKPIGTFQALQHKAADMKIQATLARASIEAAAATYEMTDTADEKKAAVSRAKARAADASLFIAKESIQLHGAIGYTDEYDIGLFIRKTLTLANLYGSATAHRKRYAALVPDEVDR
jgi:alkylation response protein AidB-like acyl-CoA dehydrogenase